VDRRVVCDAEQPPVGIGRQRLLRRRLDRLEQRFLQHVLAIDNRTRHAGAVAMQLRPQLLDQPLKGRRVLGGRTLRGHVFCRHFLRRRGAYAVSHAHRPQVFAARTLWGVIRADVGFGSANANRAGNQIPAITPARERTAATPVAAANPWVEAQEAWTKATSHMMASPFAKAVIRWT